MCSEDLIFYCLLEKRINSVSTFEASTTGGMYSLLGGSRNEIGECVCVCVKWVCVCKVGVCV